MSDDKFELIVDAIGKDLDIEVKAENINAESFFDNKSILIIKVGNDEWPATEQDIINVRSCIELAFKNLPSRPFCIVTHHAMDFSMIEIEQLIERISNSEGVSNENETGVCEQ